MTEKESKFIFGLIVLTFAVLLIVAVVKPEWTLAYKQGVLDTKREAFSHGLMTKEVDKDDKVIYRWIEPHKYNEQ